MEIFYKIKKLKYLLALLSIPLLLSPAYAGSDLKIGQDFNLFTSKNLGGYLKPLFTSLEESFNSNLHIRAVYPTWFNVGLDISIMGMYIPESQKTFDAELPGKFGDPNVAHQAYKTDEELVETQKIKGTMSQPTVYGAASQAIFSSPQFNNLDDKYYRSVAFAEGRDVTFMSGLPIAQLFVDIPTRTQVRFRFLPLTLSNESLTYWAITASQQFNHFVGLFADDPNMGLAVHGAYHSMSRSNGIDISSWAFGVHWSKMWDDWSSIYAAAQYEGISGSFEAVRDKKGASQSITNSPYLEIRNGDNLKFDIEGFTNYRIMVGAAAKASIVEFHLDIAYASQPIITGGLQFYILTIGKPKPESKIEKYERIEKIETKEIYREKETIREKDIEREKIKEKDRTKEVDSTKIIPRTDIDTTKPKGVQSPVQPGQQVQQPPKGQPQGQQNPPPQGGQQNNPPKQAILKD